MSYATLEQLTARFGERLLLQITDRENPPAGVIDASVVARALTDTDALIDSYLSARYALPLAAVPPLLTDMALAIAGYKLHPFKPDAKIERDYTDALAALVRIGKGEQRLPLAGIEPPTSGGSGVETTDRARPFTEDNLRSYI